MISHLRSIVDSLGDIATPLKGNERDRRCIDVNLGSTRGKKRVVSFHLVILPEPLVTYVFKAYHEHALGGHLAP